MATLAGAVPAHFSADKLQQKPKLVDGFQKMVQDLADELGPCSGLDSDDVDHTRLEEIMELYESDINEWQQYALADFTRPYTRNLVDKGNGKSNLLILVWTPGKGSPIHDHADAHCIMKVLHGKLKEELYTWPDKGQIENGKPSPPKATRKTTMREGDVTYMSDQLGLHRISNPDPERVAVSLHLYTPPHAATRGCHIFDAKTGKPTRVMQCQYSEFGKRV